MNTRLTLLAAFTLFAAACGSNEQKEDKPPFEASSTPAQASAPSGEMLYKRSCTSCHMANGEGIPNVYPPLAKSDYLVDKDRAITQVIKGSSGEIVVNGNKYNNTMPPQQLNDEEIAAVLSYVYSSWENNGTKVTADEVKAIRAKAQ
jgi:nitrite reductase (NO-forming)